MPSAAKFTATSTMGVRQTHAIEILDDAVSDSEGNMTLPDGRHLHHVDLVPAPTH